VHPERTGSAWKKGAADRIVHMQMFRKMILPSMILPKTTCGAGLHAFPILEGRRPAVRKPVAEPATLQTQNASCRPYRSTSDEAKSWMAKSFFGSSQNLVEEFSPPVHFAHWSEQPRGAEDHRTRRGTTATKQERNQTEDRQARKGIRIEDTILVTKDGYQMPAPSPKRLEI
jgi:hypothetical protein